MQETVRPNNSNAEKWLFYSLLGIIAFLPLPLGSNRIWAWSISEFWIFSISTWWMFLVLKGSIRLPEHFKKSWLPLASLLGFAFFTIFQILPFNYGEKPIDLRNRLNWNLYSLDPHSTMQQLLKTSAYICLFTLIISLVNSEKRIKMVLYTFFFSGLFQASYGSLMTLTGIEEIFCIAKEAYIGTATGTFIHRNHFANYVTMCIAAGTALLLLDLSSKRSSGIKDGFIRLLKFIMSKKMLLRIGLAISVVGIVLSRSRMGNTAFVISLVVAGILWMFLTRRVTRNALILLVSFIIIDLLVVGNWFGFEKVQERLQNTSTSSETRDEVIRDTLVYIQDNPLMGTGGGSYYAVYPYYKQSDVVDYYNYTHNDYLQFLSEYGVIGTLFIIIFVISSTYTALVTMVKRNNPTMQATAFTSIMVIIALLMHSIVDFNLQIMANAASAVMILGLAWVARHLPTRSTKRRYHGEN